MTVTEKFYEIRILCNDIIDECNHRNDLIEDIEGEWEEDILKNYKDNSESIEVARDILNIFE